MDAARIKAARRRLWRAWVFGGLAWSILFVGLATGLTWLMGSAAIQTVQLALTFALVTCGGLYAFVYLGAGVAAVIRWATRRLNVR